MRGFFAEYILSQLIVALLIVLACLSVSFLGLLVFQNKYLWVILGLAAGIVSGLLVKYSYFPGAFLGLFIGLIICGVLMYTDEKVGALVVSVFMVLSAAFVLFLRILKMRLSRAE